MRVELISSTKHTGKDGNNSHVEELNPAPEEHDYHALTAYYGIEDGNAINLQDNAGQQDGNGHYYPQMMTQRVQWMYRERITTSTGEDEEEYPFKPDFDKLKLVSQTSKDLISGFIRENEKELSLIIPELVVLVSILFYYEIEKGEDRQQGHTRLRSRGPSFNFGDLFKGEDDSDDSENVPSVQSGAEENDYFQITAYYGIEDDADGWDSRRSSMFGDYGRVHPRRQSPKESAREYPFEPDFEALKLVSQTIKDTISGYIRENEKEFKIIIPKLVILITILFYHEIEKGQGSKPKLSFGAVIELFGGNKDDTNKDSEDRMVTDANIRPNNGSDRNDQPPDYSAIPDLFDGDIEDNDAKGKQSYGDIAELFGITAANTSLIIVGDEEIETDKEVEIDLSYFDLQ